MAKPGPKPRIEPADALAVFEDREDLGEPLMAPEIADALACSRRTALDKLHELDRDGRVRSKQVGGRSRVYWVPIDESIDTETRLKRLSNELDDPLTVGSTVYEDGDSHPLDGASAGDVAPEPGEGEDSRRGTGAVGGEVDGALADLALDADRREAVRAMYAYLAEHGSARKSDFANDVFPEHPAGYTSIGGWWNRLGKEALASLPGVEKPAEGRPIWRFSGE
jgi:hypothetical protein